MIHKVEGNYKMAIPFKEKTPKLPVNKETAKKRLSSLKKKQQNDENLCSMYAKEMWDLISKGCTEEVPQNELARNDGKVWYLPHHAVFHERKPGKLRVVFDCASLNSRVLQGSDLTIAL